MVIIFNVVMRSNRYGENKKQKWKGIQIVQEQIGMKVYNVLNRGLQN